MAAVAVLTSSHIFLFQLAFISTPPCPSVIGPPTSREMTAAKCRLSISFVALFKEMPSSTGDKSFRAGYLEFISIVLTRVHSLYMRSKENKMNIYYDDQFLSIKVKRRQLNLEPKKTNSQLAK